MVCALVVSGGAVAPARAVNINFNALDCQQSDPPQTDIIRTAAGIATLPEVDSPRYVTCSVPRSPLAAGAVYAGFYVDGDSNNGATTSCTLSSYTFYGTLQGSTSFTVTGIPNWTYDSWLSLPPNLAGYYDYMSMTCLLPAHGNGILRGVTAIQ
jgi:hypothetical protein